MKRMWVVFDSLHARPFALLAGLKCALISCSTGVLSHTATALRPVACTFYKCIKSWLGLTRSTSAAVLHHPNVLNIPSLASLKTKAKLSYLASVVVSQDPLIEEFTGLSSSPFFEKNVSIPRFARGILQKGVQSVEAINRKTLPYAIKGISKELESTRCSNCLSELTVQNKFADICLLEENNHVWNRILQGLPSGQLSFMIRAASDTWPTPLNLVHWRYWTDPKRPLCGYHFPTTKHLLNSCPIVLCQDCYTWRHDSILRKLLLFLRQHLNDKGRVFGDLKGFRVMENPPSTVPIDILPILQIGQILCL